MGKKWKIVGSRKSADGAIGQLLEAQSPLKCFECGRTIGPGEFFTRRLRKGGGSYTQFPVCGDDSPFEVIDDEASV